MSSSRFILRPSGGGSSVASPPLTNQHRSGSSGAGHRLIDGANGGQRHGGAGTGARSARAAFDSFLAQRSTAVNTQLQRLRQRDAVLDLQHQQAVVSSRTVRGPPMRSDAVGADPLERPHGPLHTPLDESPQQQRSKRQQIPNLSPSRNASLNDCDDATVAAQDNRRGNATPPQQSTALEGHMMPARLRGDASPSPMSCFAELCASVWSPLGLAGDSEARCARTTQLLEHWLRSVSSGSRSSFHVTTAEDSQDERDACCALWHLLHRTVFYCVNALTPNGGVGSSSAEDDDVRMPVPLRSVHDAAAGDTSGGRRKATAAATSPQRRTEDGDHGAADAVDVVPLTPRAWVFVLQCLAEMGYPRDAVYVQSPEASDVQELILAVLWLTRRYMLGAVAVLVQLRDAAPFLYAHERQPATDDVHKEAAGCAPQVLRYLHGDAWSPSTSEDVRRLNAFVQSRKAQVDAVVAEAKQQLHWCIKEVDVAAAAPVPSQRGHKWTLHDDDNDNDTCDDDGNVASAAVAEEASGAAARRSKECTSSVRAQTLAAQSTLKLRRMIDLHMHRTEALLLQKVALMDAVGASHSTEDLSLCMPEQQAGFESVQHALRCWKNAPTRATQIASALTEAMHLLMSFARRDAPNGGGSCAAFGDMREALSEDAMLEGRLAKPQSPGGRAGCNKSDDHNRGTDIGGRTRDNATSLQDDDDDDANRPTDVASLLSVLQRYERTEACAFYDGRRRWVRAQYRAPSQHHEGSSPANKLRRPSSDVAEGLYAIHADEAHRYRRASAVREAVSASIDQRYSVRACVAAEMAAIADDRPHSRSAGGGGVSSDNDEVDAFDMLPLAPSENHAVVRECPGLQLASRNQPMASGMGPHTHAGSLVQTVLVGPPAPGRTTSARVEIDRMRLLLADIGHPPCGVNVMDVGSRRRVVRRVARESSARPTGVDDGDTTMPQYRSS